MKCTGLSHQSGEKSSGWFINNNDHKYKIINKNIPAGNTDDINMKSIKLEIIEGGHLTPTERKAVKAMLQKGWSTAHNAPDTKSYRITNLTERDFSLETGTKAV